MSASCFYHPSISTEQTCAQCGMSVCDECRQIVAGKPVCLRCVSAIRDRIAREAAAGSEAAAPQTPSMPIPPISVPQIAAPAPASYAPPVTMPQSVTQKPVTLQPLAIRTLLAILFGSIIGIIGAVIWEKFVFYTGFNIGYLTALIGFGVGFGVLMGYRQHGLSPAIIGAVIALAAQIFGYYLLMTDELNKALGAEGRAAVIMPASFFFKHIGEIIDGSLDWLIIAIGVYGGFKTSYAPKRR